MIGYYIHHHGDGHRQRALSIGKALGSDITFLGTGIAGRTGNMPFIALPDDRLEHGRFDGIDRTDRPDALHYAPLDHDGIRQRVALISRWIADTAPSLMIVDVSVEIAMLARLASVPTVYVRLSGHRADAGHLEAFRGASALLAPFHDLLDDERIPAFVRAKTFFAPGITAAASKAHVEPNTVLGVVGRGGGSSDGDRWAVAARAVPDRLWRVIGPCTVPAYTPCNLELRGWVDDADEMIARAGLVIGGAGDGLVGSVIASRRPFLCIPEPRPFDEQFSKARRLATLGAAVVSQDWPEPAQWTTLFARTSALDPASIAGLASTGGAERTAAWLRTLVGERQSMGSGTA